MPVRHVVSLSDSHAHLVTIASTWSASGQEPLPDPLVLVMPVWTPGSYLVREFSRHVESPRATLRGRRQRLPVRKLRKNAWAIYHGGASEVVFTYDLYCNDLSVRTNHVDETHVYLNGASTFFFAEHAPQEGADLLLKLPSAFRVATVLDASGPRHGPIYRAATYDELVDSPVHAGEHVERDFQVLGRPHQFVVWGEARGANWDDVVRDVRTIVETEAAWFGNELPYSAYTFFWLLTPKNRGGLGHRDCTVLTVSPQMFEDRKGYLDVLSLVAHEFLHLWNVKRIRPAGLTPYRYEEENYTRQLWWFEGGTSYFDWRILRKANLCTPEEYLEHLGEEIARLEDTPGRLAQSASEASFDAWIKLYRSDENTVNSTVSYYLKGEIICALLDIELQIRTSGARNLADVLTHLWQVFGARDLPVPEDALAGIFAEVAGQSMDDVLVPWVEDAGELPVDAVLSKVGLRVSRERNEKRSGRGALGIRVRNGEGKVVVTSVLRGRGAHIGGLDVGDELVAINGHRVEPGKLELALQGQTVGSRVEILVSREGSLRTVHVTLDPPSGDKVKLTLSDHSTAEQRTRLLGWLGALPGSSRV